MPDFNLTYFPAMPVKFLFKSFGNAMELARSSETGSFMKPADWMQIFKDVQSKVSYVLGREKPAEESNDEYEKLKAYILHLEDHLNECQKQAYQLVQRHRELGQSLSDFGKAVKLLGKCEEDGLRKAFSELGNTSEILSTKLEREAHNLLINFEEPLKDYVRAMQSIKATITERANAFRHHSELVKTIKFKEIELMKIKLLRLDKLPDAELELDQLRIDCEEALRIFETIVNRMSTEMVGFQEQKTVDMGITFHEFAKGQARLENDIAEAWRSILPAVEACSA